MEELPWDTAQNSVLHGSWVLESGVKAKGTSSQNLLENSL